MVSQNIFILGASRCGKSTLTNKLLDKYKSYEPLRADAVVISLHSLNFYKYKIPENKKIDLNQIIPSHKEKLFFLKTHFNELKIDLFKTDKKIIVDTHDLSVIDVLKNFDSKCDIYCLGMPNESTKNLMKVIRENDKNDDWSYYVSNNVLKRQCEKLIDRSQEMYEECQSLGISFFDTSGNREEKINLAMREIEMRSIRE